MTTLKKQGLIFIAGLIGILLLGIFGNTPQPSASPVNSALDLTEKQTQTSSCDGATQWTPHGPYVGPASGVYYMTIETNQGRLNKTLVRK